jgi:hypothetical protein
MVKLSHSGTGLGPAGLTSKVAHIAGSDFQGYVIAIISGIGTGCTTSCAVLAILFFYSGTIATRVGPVALCQTVNCLCQRQYLVPLTKVNLTVMIGGCVGVVMGPLATGFDYAIITDGQPVF